eukprot:5095218-Heterocapsa_arctica.AAC.1
MMRDATGIQLKAEATEVEKEAYQWTMIQDAKHGWSGDVMARLGTKAEVLHMFATLEGKVIEVADGGRIVIE